MQKNSMRYVAAIIAYSLITSGAASVLAQTGSAPLAASCSGTANSNNVITWTASSTGGTSPYKYLWSGVNVSGTSSVATATYSATGTYSATVLVGDTTTSTVTTSCSATVLSLPTPTPPPSTSTPNLASCVKTAVIAHENALITAYDAFGAAMKSALQAHRDALSAAWDITDAQARNDAIRAADRAYNSAARQANSDLHKATKTADRKYKIDRKACTAGNDSGEHKDRGEHNGLLKEKDKGHNDGEGQNKNKHGE